ncbi:MAG: TetR/AcrR family transcriptional regulator [Cyanobacteria bacterium P01_F01_bin.143]
MARKKEFDKEEVLAKAMNTFWRYGYEGTSMQLLVETMGINRGSLYDTFGDKRSLFQSAIAHYEQTVVEKTIAALKMPDADKQTIINLFQDLVTRSLEEQNCYGCLITNTAIELCPDDAETQKTINHNFRCITQALEKALSQAQAKGQIKRDPDIACLASYLTCSLQGLRVVAKVNRDRETLNNIVKVILSVLDYGSNE